MKSQYYNLIFVYTSFRRHNNIINFIKGLGDSFKIGIILPEHHSNWNDIEETYLQYCLSAGASMVEIGMPFSDPLADGPIVQSSSKIAIDNKYAKSRLKWE